MQIYRLWRFRKEKKIYWLYKIYKICFKKDSIKLFLIYEINKCIEYCPVLMSNFNYNWNNKCPENTKELEEQDNRNNCSCNKDINAYWYKYSIVRKNFFSSLLKNLQLKTWW